MKDILFEKQKQARHSLYVNRLIRWHEKNVIQKIISRLPGFLNSLLIVIDSMLVFPLVYIGKVADAISDNLTEKELEKSLANTDESSAREQQQDAKVTANLTQAYEELIKSCETAINTINNDIIDKTKDGTVDHILSATKLRGKFFEAAQEIIKNQSEEYEKLQVALKNYLELCSKKGINTTVIVSIQNQFLAHLQKKFRIARTFIEWQHTDMDDNILYDLYNVQKEYNQLKKNILNDRLLRWYENNVVQKILRIPVPYFFKFILVFSSYTIISPLILLDTFLDATFLSVFKKKMNPKIEIGLFNDIMKFESSMRGKILDNLLSRLQEIDNKINKESLGKDIELESKLANQDETEKKSSLTNEEQELFIKLETAIQDLIRSDDLMTQLNTRYIEYLTEFMKEHKAYNNPSNNRFSSCTFSSPSTYTRTNADHVSGRNSVTEKPIIILIGGLAQGKGDWVHLLEIARDLKKRFGDKYEIVGFVCPGRQRFEGVFDAEPHIKEFEDKYKQRDSSNGELTDNRFFDRLYHGYDNLFDHTNTEDLRKRYQNFINNFEDRIFCRINIANLISCKLLDHPNFNFHKISMHEYGGFQHYKEERDLGMGFGVNCHGIRIYSLPNAESDQFETIKKEVPDLYAKMIMDLKSTTPENAIEAYFKERKLLPVDLRNEEAALAFIRLNLRRFGASCDFYLPEKLLNDSFKLKIADLCKDLHLDLDLDCKYIDPYSDRTVAKADEKKEFRIFSGFNLSDDAYKSMYLNEQATSCGISGDDGWSLAISSGKLPFHGKIEGLQKNVMEDLIELVQLKNLTNLLKYFECFLNDPINYEELVNTTIQNQQLINQEFAILCKDLRDKKNIFTVLANYISSIEPNLSIKARSAI